MLNTIMALWNHNPGESKQRVVKVFSTFFLISVSVFLLLFTLNSSTWSLFAGTQRSYTKKAGTLRMSQHRVSQHRVMIATAGNTPASRPVKARSKPAAPVSHTRTIVPPCIPTVTVVIKQQVIVTPTPTIIYYGNSNSSGNNSSIHPVQPKIVQVRKSKLHPTKKVDVKVVPTPLPRTRETINITLPASPVAVTATVEPTITPVATVEAVPTSVPTEGTVVSNVPAAVMLNATPEPVNTFAHSLQRKATLQIPVSPSVVSHPKKDSSKKTSNRKVDHVYESVVCSNVSIHKESNGETLRKVKRHIGMLLGSALSGTLMFFCFALIKRRED